jgi:hypothetical protein
MMIDDALIVAQSHGECKRRMSLMCDLFRTLGLQPADDKTEGPAETLDFLGFDLDSTKEIITVKQSRLQSAGKHMRRMVADGSATCDALRSLAGKLSWFAIVLPGARSFMRRIWDFLRDTVDTGVEVPLSPGAVADLEWWLRHIDANDGAGDFRGSKMYCGDDVTPEDVFADLADSYRAQLDHDAANAEGERLRPVSVDESALVAAGDGTLRCVELASGAGGFAVGAASVDGVEVVLAVEGCPAAAATYERAHGLAPMQIDLTDVDAVVDAVRGVGVPVDVIFASPPCQAWSPAGTHTPGDKRIGVMGAVVEAVLFLPTLVTVVLAS